MKQSVCLYFKVHQPYQLKPYAPGGVEVDHEYFDKEADEMAINKLADESYLPANSVLLSNIKQSNGAFKVSFSISGITIELLEKYRPDVIGSFRELVNTGAVEILAETYYQSLSSLYSKKEFEIQVEMHSRKIRSTFGLVPQVFRNTELLYSNSLAQMIYELRYRGILCDGVPGLLSGRSVNRPYKSPGTADFTLLLRNSNLSDDIAFRFDDKNWNEYPLTAEKFAEWINAHPENDQVLNLFMDYETFGIHKKADTGIFDFLAALPHAVLSGNQFEFSTPSEVIERNHPADVYDIPFIMSWGHKTEQGHTWEEDVKQNNTLKKIYDLEKLVSNSTNAELVEHWRRLQAVDYIFYMGDEPRRDRNHINPFTSPQEAHGFYKNIITDLEISFIREQLKKHKLDFIPQTHNVY